MGLGLGLGLQTPSLPDSLQGSKFRLCQGAEGRWEKGAASSPKVRGSEALVYSREAAWTDIKYFQPNPGTSPSVSCQSLSCQTLPLYLFPKSQYT